MVLIRARIALMHDLCMGWIKGMESFSLGGWKRPLSNFFLPKIPKFPGLSFVACKMGPFHPDDL